MTDVRFTLVATQDGDALYESASPPDAATLLYFLLVGTSAGGDGGPPATLDLPGTWGYPGAYLVAGSPITTKPADLAGALSLSGAGSTRRGVVWIDDSVETPAATVTMLSTGPDTGQVVDRAATLPFGNVDLALPSMTQVRVGGSSLELRQDGIVLERGGGGVPLAPDDATVSLALDGDRPGRLAFGGSWDAFNFYTLFRDNPYATDTPRGGELRYATEDANGALRQLRYPVLPPPGQGQQFDLDVVLDALAPYDGERTALRFRKVPPGLSAPYAATVAGQAVTLVPLVEAATQAGFYLARRPDAGGEQDCVYLAPVGPFAVTAVPDGPAKLMCGLSGLEYILLHDADVLEFVPSRPAHVAPPVAASPRSSLSRRQPQLDGATTTSWVALRPQSASAYYGQPSASVSFAARVLTGMQHPAAVAALVRALPQGARTDAFPLALYGAATVTGDGTPTAAELLAQVEHRVLTPIRGGVLRRPTPAARAASPADRATAAEDGPADPVFSDARGAPLQGGRSATPNGQVVVLNTGDPAPAGTWQQVLLGRTPCGYLSFDADAGGTVDATLASTLLRDQLFLVLRDWQKFAVNPLISVAGYQISIAPQTGTPVASSPVLVVKYATAHSLEELVDRVDAWADPAYFVGDPDAVAAAQEALRTAITIAVDAKGRPDDPFGGFRDIVLTQPGWTGLLAFDAPINGREAAPDLQMLFAGIEGQLTAHHVGLDGSSLVAGEDGPDLADSSVFGVIHYPPDRPGQGPRGLRPTAPPADAAPRSAPPDFAFAVRQLDVAIANSSVTEFHAQVGMTVNTLFGRPVALSPQNVAHPNEIIIAGTYQRHGDVGTVTFATTDAGTLDFVRDGDTIRVLDRLVVGDAALVPVATADADAAGGDAQATVSARLTFGGQLAFVADPFPHAPDLDLFSYGTRDGDRTEGLRLSGLSLLITFKLDATGKRSGQPVITPDLSAVLCDDNATALRGGSLVAGLPLTVDGFVQAPDGLDADTVGGLPLHVVQLMSQPAGASDGGRPPSGSRSYTTARPPYAVVYRLPLGSLGSLADAHASLDASLVVGWGPSATVPDDDGAALFVALPQVSAGAFGFNLQGLLKTTFGDANLLQVQLEDGPVYVMLFNHVALSVLGFTFPPQVLADFLLFSGGDRGRALGWSVAATKVGGDA